MFHEPMHPVSLERQGIEIRDLPLGESELAGVRIDSRRQDLHSAPTLGYRFGDALAWMTDTAHDPDAAGFVSGCRALAHEAWYTTAHPRNPDVHSSAAQAADIAQRAGVERLLLIHMPPFDGDVSALAVEAGAIVPGAEVAVDGGDFSGLIRRRAVGSRRLWRAAGERLGKRERGEGAGGAAGGVRFASLCRECAEMSWKPHCGRDRRC